MNEDLYDALLRQHVNLQRMTQGEVSQILKQLRIADGELNAKLSQRLERMGGVADFTSERWQGMIAEVRRIRSSIIQQTGQTMGTISNEVVDLSVNASLIALQNSIPVEINFAAPNIATVQQLARETPFGGADMARDLAQWFVDLEEADFKRINGAVQAGMMHGETTPEIINRVMKAQDLTRTNADAISRTAVNHASNTARTEVFKENSSVILALKAVATLDGRTSPICRARDGHYDSLEVGGDMTNVPQPHIEGSPRRPPFHPRCRTLMIAELDPDGIEAEMPERPFVRDTRTRRRREIDFRAEAKAAEGDNWKNLSRGERDALIKERRLAWTRENVGTVSGNMNYDQWLRKQPESFQNDVLGGPRADLFRNGLTMDQYVDVQGRQLTIAELRDRYPNYVAGQVDAPTTAEIARQDQIARLQEARVQTQAVETEADRIARQNALDEKELWDPALEQKRATADQMVREDFKTTDTPVESDVEFQRDRQKALDARREAYIERNRASLQADLDQRIERAIKMGAPDPFYPLEDDNFLKTLSPAQQDMLLGPAGADLFRTGTPSRLLVDWPDDGGPPRPRTQDELLYRHASTARTPGTGWTRAQQEAWNAQAGVNDVDAIRTWSEHDAALTSLQNPDSTRKQTGYKGLTQPGKYQPRYSPELELQHLNEAFSTMPVYDGVVYRGIGMTPENLEALLETGLFELPHHSSASTKVQVAVSFAGAGQNRMQKLSGRDDIQRVHFTFKKQQNSRMVMDFALDGEDEVVLMKGTKYRITGKVQDPTGGWHIEVEEIIDAEGR